MTEDKKHHPLCVKEQRCELADDCDYLVEEGAARDQACRELDAYKAFLKTAKEGVLELGLEGFLFRTIWNINAHLQSLHARTRVAQASPLQDMANILAEIEREIEGC
jgi:hypothetical protein